MPHSYPTFTGPPSCLADEGLLGATRVGLAVYGDALEPRVVSALLGVAADTAWRKGDRVPTLGGELRAPTGCWLRTIHCAPRTRPATALTRLLARLPQDPAVWRTLAAHHEIQVRISPPRAEPPAEFDLPARLVAQLAALNARLIASY